MGRKQDRNWKYVYLCVTCLISFSLCSCATIVEIRKRGEAEDHLVQGQRLLVQGNYEGALGEYDKILQLSLHQPPEDIALFNMGLIHAHYANPKKNYEKSLRFFIKTLNEHPESPLAEQAKIWVGVLLESKKAGERIEKSRQTVQEPQKIRPTLKEPQTTRPLDEKPEEHREAQGEAWEFLARSQRLLAQGDYEGSIGENEKVLSLSDRGSPKDEALFNLGLIYAHLENPKKDFWKSIDFFKRLMKEYPQSFFLEQARVWVGVLQEHQQLNQVIEKLKQVDIEMEEKKRRKAK